MLKFDWDVEILLYLSPEMESVAFVQIFFSIIFFFLLHSVIDIYWHKVLCGNVNNMNGICYYIFILVQYIHLCQYKNNIMFYRGKLELGTCQLLITFHKSILIWVCQFTFYFVLERLCNNIKGVGNPFVLAYINNSAHFKAMKIFYQTKRYYRLHINLRDI